MVCILLVVNRLGCVKSSGEQPVALALVTTLLPETASAPADRSSSLVGSSEIRAMPLCSTRGKPRVRDTAGDPKSSWDAVDCLGPLILDRGKDRKKQNRQNS